MSPLCFLPTRVVNILNVWCHPRPQKLADLARDAGKGLGEMQDVPKALQEGFDSAETSEETRQMARSFGATTQQLKETAVDLAGDYREVASEFAGGLQVRRQSCLA